MSELFEQEKPKKPDHCPKCGSVNIVLVPVPDIVDYEGFIPPSYRCNDCGKEIK